MHADVTTCSPHFTCWWTISCLPVGVAGGRPRITAAERITLAVAQILLRRPAREGAAAAAETREAEVPREGPIADFR